MKHWIRQKKRVLREIATRLELIVAPGIYRCTTWNGKHTKYSAVENVVVVAPGDGNIGDQAMLSAFLENTSGTVRVIVRKPSDVHIEPQYRDRVEVLSMGHLIYGRFGMRHIAEVREFRHVAESASRVSVIGADIMDGAYNSRASVRRSNMAMLAVRSGTEARVLGFSWNGSPARSAMRALQQASLEGVQLMLRDPLSHKRAMSDGLHNCIESADLVFTSVASDETDISAKIGASAKPVALVNISAHIQKTIDQRSQYVDVVRHLQARGYQVVLVPHVSRPDSDDVRLVAELSTILQDPSVEKLSCLLEPSQIRALCKAARIVVTGRMHLAIIALSQNVPSIVLASQGKVEGLVLRFNGNAVAIQPAAGMSETICDAIDGLVTEEGNEEFQNQLDQSRVLAARNFE